jgi:hypothetical protein
MRKTDLGDFNIIISKLLNCIFCNEATLNIMDQVYSKDEIKDEISTNSSRKKKKKNDLEI